MATLPPKDANWWQPIKVGSLPATQKYTHQELTQLVTHQVEQHLNREAKGKKDNRISQLFKLKSVEPVISQANFDRLVNLSKQTYYPLMTLHGTDKPSKVRSITDHGYLLPGEDHPTAGYSVCVKNGNYYGEGIYTSNQFEVSYWYSALGKNQQVQLIINLVLLGKVGNTHQYCYTQNKLAQESFDQLQIIIDTTTLSANTNQSLVKTELAERKERFNQLWKHPRYQSTLQKFFHYPDQPLVREHLEDFYCYHCQQDTALVPPNLQMIISGSSQNVIPVAIVTLESKEDWRISKDYLAVNFQRNLPAKLYQLDLPKPPTRWSPTQIDYAVHLLKICPNYYLVCPPLKYYPSSLIRKQVSYQHWLMVPLSINDKVVHREIQQFLGSLKIDQATTDRRIIFYHSNSKVYSYKISDHQQYQGFLSSHLNSIADDQQQFKYSYSRQPTQSLIPVLTQALNQITKQDTQTINYLYLLIDNPVDNLNQYQELIDTWKPLLQVRQVIIKLIFLNHKVANRLSDFYSLKLNLQTISCYEDFLHLTYSGKQPIVGGAHSGTLTEELERIRLQNQNLKLIPKSHWAIPFPEGFVGEGFLTHLARTPEWDADLSTGNDHLIFRGEPVRGILIDHQLYQVRLIDQSEDLVLGHWLTVGQLLIPLICQVRNWLYVHPARFRYYQQVISTLTEPLMTRLDHLIINQDLAEFTKVKTLYYQLSGLLTELQTFSGISFSGKWFQQLTRLRFGRQIARRVHHTFKLKPIIAELQAAGCLTTNVRTLKDHLNEPADALLYTPVVGHGLRINRSDSSEIEPWLIRVEYVSNDIGRLSQLYQKDQLGIKVVDPSRQAVITDILPLDSITEGRPSEHQKLGYGWIFTRNPYLYQPSQPLALLTVSWISLLEGIFRRIHLPGNHQSDKITPDLLKPQLNLALKLVEQIKTVFNRQSMWLELLDKIKQEDDFEEYLTTSHDVPSICLILGLLTSDSAQEIFCDQNNTTKFSRLAFGLMAESVMRSCRAYLRSGKMKDVDHLRRVLDLNRKTDLNSYQFNLARACARTGKFYRLRLTNCSPFALVSTLGFIECYHLSFRTSGAPPSDSVLADTYLGSNNQMKKFLTRHLPGISGPEAQVALFLQGIKFNQAKGRRGVNFLQPGKIIQEIKNEEIQKIQKIQNLMTKANSRSRRRQLQRIENAIPFLKYHQSVKIFNHAEISDLNLTRTGSDRIVLLSGGMLKHHCGYPDCPDYLKDFSTPRDRADPTGRSRHGLQQHLMHDWINQNYVPGFHLIATDISRHSRDLEEFIAKMDDYYLNENRNQRISKLYKSLIDREQKLKSAWNYLK